MSLKIDMVYLWLSIKKELEINSTEVRPPFFVDNIKGTGIRIRTNQASLGFFFGLWDLTGSIKKMIEFLLLNILLVLSIWDLNQ